MKPQRYDFFITVIIKNIQFACILKKCLYLQPQYCYEKEHLFIGDALVFTGHEAEAQGLTIFNTTTKCVETWNGAAWIQSCPPGGPALPPAAPAASNQTLCPAAKVSDLVATTVTLVSNCAELVDATWLLWSPVSVMYTYQYQDLEIYKATSGGDPTNYVWYVKKKSAAGDGDVIPGVTTAKYRVPIHYRTSSATVTYDSNPVSLASDPTATFCPKQRQRIINGIHSISRELASVV